MCTILSHRGLWASPDQRNSLAALEASFALGFGLETDIRDALGTLVISHDPPSGGEVTLRSMLEAHRGSTAAPLALNVKADGLQQQLARELADAGNPEYFVFDMSVPDALGYLRSGMRYFTRQSEYEVHPSLYEGAAGVWVDCFEGDWFNEDVITAHLEAGKQVCLVSPELHGRDADPAWRRWAGWASVRLPDVLVCTDYPVDASKALAA